MGKLISIIMPFYNVEAHLAEAIDSVLNQTYFHWELLLIDDGSIDSSTFIALQYCNLHQGKIRYLSHEDHINKGVTVSRNLGLKEATGQFIALLDADDLWLPNKLFTQIHIAESHPEVSLIGGASLYWYSWKDPEMKDVIVPVGCSTDVVLFSPKLFFQLYPIGGGAAPCPSGLLMNAEVLRKHNGFEEDFKEEYQVYEDQAYLVKFYLHENCYFTRDYFDKYRQRPGSLVNDLQETGRYTKVRLFFMEWLIQYLKNESIDKFAIKIAVRIAILEIKYPKMAKLISIIFNRKAEDF